MRRLAAFAVLACASAGMLAGPAFCAPVITAPGIAVCEPVSAAPSAASFGTGCALWLQMSVGGQPQFGQTPVWNSLDRARRELNRPNLQLSAADAQHLAPILGINCAAVGTLRGAGTHLTLTYRLLREPSGTLIGPTYVVKGTPAQIVLGLPPLARRLDDSLGMNASGVPGTNGLTPADLRLLGQVRRQTTPLTRAQQNAVELLAARSPLAGLLNLSLGAGRTNAHFNACVQTLLTQVIGNTLVWGEIARLSPLALLPHADALAILTARYPGSDNLAVAETYRFRALQDHPAELKSAARVVKDAPRSPDAWLTYARAISETAQALRQGRIYDDLSPDEARTLGGLYAEQEGTTQKAVTLDPLFAHGWQRLAEAATFNSDAPAADHAIQAALALSGDKAEVYDWALEMYQPKWNDDPAKLLRFQQLAASDTTLSAAETLDVADKLYYSGNPEGRNTLLAGFIVRRRATLAAHPNDGQGHWDLAEALASSGQKPESVAEYRLAAMLMPENAVFQYDLAVALYGVSAEDQALTPLQDAVHLDPDYADAYAQLAFWYKDKGNFGEAKSEAHTALRLNPAEARAYEALGEIALREDHPADAITNYQAALRFGDFRWSTYSNLVTALENTKQWGLLLAVGQEALRHHTQTNGDLYNALANAALEEKAWDQSLTFSQQALALSADDPLAHENIAEADLGAGKLPDARAEWRKVLTYKDDRLRATAQDFLKKYP